MEMGRCWLRDTINVCLRPVRGSVPLTVERLHTSEIVVEGGE